MYKNVALLLGVCMLPILALAQAQPNSSLPPLNPAPVTDVKHIYPQQKLANCDASAARTQSLGSAKMKINPQGDVEIQGADDQGKPWEASLETSPAADCEVWQADLSGHGRHDLIIVNYGTNSSGGWDTNLSLLIFDQDRRPFPWQATGNFHIGSAGVSEIVSSVEPSTASIIVTQRQGDKFSGFTYADNTLEIAGDRLSRAPMLSPANRTPNVTNADAYDTLGSLTTVGSKAEGGVWPHILSLTGDTDDDIRLHMSDGKVLAEPKIVVLDLRSGERFIDFSPNKTNLQQMFRDKAAVIQVGTSCEQTACEPLILWGKL